MPYIIVPGNPLPITNGEGVPIVPEFSVPYPVYFDPAGLQYQPPTQSNMDAATIAKIRSHKCGSRKLATSGALQRMNATLGGAGPALAAVIAGDPRITEIVGRLNTALTGAYAAMGLQGAAGGAATIEVSEITSGDIPVSLWLGKINLPTAQEDEATQVAVDGFKATFADQAGLLRARLALVVQAVGTLNDLGNSPEKPNVGGQVDASTRKDK